MKIKLTKLLAIGFALLVTNQATKLSAATNSLVYQITQDYTINLPKSGNLSNLNGSLWFGNFGTSTASQIDALAGNSLVGNNLLNSWNPLARIAIAGGNVAGSVGGLLNGTISPLNSFLNQDAYILALSSTQSSWSDALADWNANGLSSVILIRTPNKFLENAPTTDFEVEATAPGSRLIFGSLDTQAGTITATSVPEPSATALLLLGAIGLGVARLRRSNG